MKTLVTGGAGFIGSNLVYQLLQDGHEVTVLDNLLSGYHSNISVLPSVRFIKGDIRDEGAVEKADFIGSCPPLDAQCEVTCPNLPGRGN